MNMSRAERLRRGKSAGKRKVPAVKRPDPSALARYSPLELIPAPPGYRLAFNYGEASRAQHYLYSGFYRHSSGGSVRPRPALRTTGAGFLSPAWVALESEFIEPLGARHQTEQHRGFAIRT